MTLRALCGPSMGVRMTVHFEVRNDFRIAHLQNKKVRNNPF